MQTEELLKNLLDSYSGTFDIHENYECGEEHYAAYAYFYSHTEKYVLVREAQLWEANAFEHSLFQIYEKPLLPEDVFHQMDVLKNHVEPLLVRKGEDCVQKNHMYSFMTFILLCEDGITGEAVKAIRKFRFEKIYKFNIRGYSLGRLVALDLKHHRLYCNHAGKELRKFYEKALGAV